MLRYSTKLEQKDWRQVLNNSKLANVFHTVEYFDILRNDGNKILYACCYENDEPIGIIVGNLNKVGYHQGLIEIGSKSGGFPLMVDKYSRGIDADKIKNDFIKYYAETYLKNNLFFFYPCFNMKDCVLEETDWECRKQYDQTVLLDLTKGTGKLWKQLNQKCRNVIRYAEKKGVTAKPVNKLEYLELFYKHYKDLRERLDTKYMSLEELKTRFDVLTKNGMADLWVASLEDKPLAYAFIWKYNSIINFVYGSSDPASLSLKPNNLIQWEIIRNYTKQGYKLYNMWGVRNMNFSEDNILENTDKKIEGYGKFKLSFGSELKNLTRFFRV